jgi:hypothetical protein
MVSHLCSLHDILRHVAEHTEEWLAFRMKADAVLTRVESDAETRRETTGKQHNMNSDAFSERVEPFEKR